MVTVIQDVLALLPDAEILQSGLGVEGNDRTLLREAGQKERRRGQIRDMNSRRAGSEGGGLTSSLFMMTSFTTTMLIRLPMLGSL